MTAEPVRVLPGEAAPRRGNSCLIGCIGTIIVSCVLLFAVVLFVVYGLGKLRDSFTSTTPVEIPDMQFTPDQAAQAQQRLSALEQGYRQGQAGTAEFTAQDINILLKSDPRLAEYTDSIYFDIQGDALMAQVSLPLDFVPGMQGRYLNGSATADVDVLNDKFVVSLKEFRMQDLQFPAQVLGEFEGEINTELNTSPEARALAQRIQSIDVANGLIRVTLKGAQ